jgi:excisionase family DNA binding protein
MEIKINGVEVVTVTQAAELVKHTQKAVYRWMERGTVKFYQIDGRRYPVKESLLERAKLGDLRGSFNYDRVKALGLVN